MKLFLDEDLASVHLKRVLTSSGHNVQTPHDAQMLGRPDPMQLKHCIETERTLLSRNYNDFELLHHLIAAAGGRHPGILAVRKDDSSRDMSPPQIVRAMANLTAARHPVPNLFIILNHWR